MKIPRRIRIRRSTPPTASKVATSFFFMPDFCSSSVSSSASASSAFASSSDESSLSSSPSDGSPLSPSSESFASCGSFEFSSGELSSVLMGAGTGFSSRDSSLTTSLSSAFRSSAFMFSQFSVFFISKHSFIKFLFGCLQYG